MTPLHAAAYHGWYDCLKLLVSNGGDVNQKDEVRRRVELDTQPLGSAVYDSYIEAPHGI